MSALAYLILAVLIIVGCLCNGGTVRGKGGGCTQNPPPTKPKPNNPPRAQNPSRRKIL